MVSGRELEVSVLKQLIVVFEHRRRFRIAAHYRSFNVSVQIHVWYVQHFPYMVHNHLKSLVKLDHAVLHLIFSHFFWVFFVRTVIKLPFIHPLVDFRVFLEFTLYFLVGIVNFSESNLHLTRHDRRVFLQITLLQGLSRSDELRI